MSIQVSAAADATGSRVTRTISKLVGPRILVRKCVNDHIRRDGKVLLYKPETVYDTSQWAEILMVSEQCKEFGQEHVGCFVHLPEFASGINRVGDNEFTVHEKMLHERLMKPFVVEM